MPYKNKQPKLNQQSISHNFWIVDQISSSFLGFANNFMSSMNKRRLTFSPEWYHFQFFYVIFSCTMTMKNNNKESTI